jgi:ribosomal protein S18 acetylase RimI-like enzyme
VRGAPVSISAPADRAETAAVGPLLARAFLDDPVWSRVGPRSRGYRRHTSRVAFWGIVRASARHGARIRVARADPADPPLGATIAFEPGAWPPPDRAFIWQLPWAALAGPLPIVRGLRADSAIRAEHIEHPHLYLWYIGVDPTRHRSGVGRALMADLHRRSGELGLSTYLETGTPGNVSFYEGLGYEAVGRIALPGGPRLWKMERPGDRR